MRYVKLIQISEWILSVNDAWQGTWPQSWIFFFFYISVSWFYITRFWFFLVMLEIIDGGGKVCSVIFFFFIFATEGIQNMVFCDKCNCSSLARNACPFRWYTTAFHFVTFLSNVRCVGGLLENTIGLKLKPHSSVQAQDVCISASSYNKLWRWIELDKPWFFSFPPWGLMLSNSLYFKPLK